MIIDVPDHRDLQQIGLEWLNLAWDNTISSLTDFKEYLDYYEEQDDEGMTQEQQDAYWRAQRYRLNNATALLQQAMELLLKARIAEVDPLLLLAKRKRNSGSGQVSFTDLRTIDATQLCSIVNTVSSTPLSADFEQFFADIRKRRNKIVHLNARNIHVEARIILLEILKALRFLFPEQDWPTFRRTHEETMVAPTLGPWEDNPTHSGFLAELRVSIDVLDPDDARAFLGYDKTKEGICCPTCTSLRVKWDDHPAELAQRRRDNSVFCVGCGKTLTATQYDKEYVEYFGE